MTTSTFIMLEAAQTKVLLAAFAAGMDWTGLECTVGKEACIAWRVEWSADFAWRLWTRRDDTRGRAHNVINDSWK